MEQGERMSARWLVRRGVRVHFSGGDRWSIDDRPPQRTAGPLPGDPAWVRLVRAVWLRRPRVGLVLGALLVLGLVGALLPARLLATEPVLDTANNTLLDNILTTSLSTSSSQYGALNGLGSSESPIAQSVLTELGRLRVDTQQMPPLAASTGLIMSGHQMGYQVPDAAAAERWLGVTGDTAMDYSDAYWTYNFNGQNVGSQICAIDSTSPNLPEIAFVWRYGSDGDYVCELANYIGTSEAASTAAAWNAFDNAPGVTVTTSTGCPIYVGRYPYGSYVDDGCSMKYLPEDSPSTDDVWNHITVTNTQPYTTQEADVGLGRYGWSWPTTTYTESELLSAARTDLQTTPYVTLRAYLDYLIDPSAYPNPLDLPQTFGGGINNLGNIAAEFGRPGATQATQADPVDSATGNDYTSVTDLSLSGVGVPFTWTRSYNSLDTTSGPLGEGWTAPYYSSLTVESNGDVNVRATDGQQDYFTDSSGTYTPPAGVNATLTLSGSTYTLTDPQGEISTYNSSGQLTGMTNQRGQGLSMAYTSGELTSITDNAGRVVDLTYNSNGNVTKVELPDGNNVQYAYTGGFLTSVTDARGHTVTYTYSSAGQLATATDQNGNTVLTNTYDSSTGRITSQENALGHTTSFAWDPTTQTATTTDPNGAVHTDVYSGNVLISQTDPVGNTASYTYDANLDVASQTDARGNVTNYTYDSSGNLTETSIPALSYTETRTYDSHHDLLSITDARGKTTTDTYNSYGQPLTITDPDGGVTTYTYNSAGLLASLTDARGNATTYAYDSAGNRTSVTDPLGHETTYTYDAEGREASVTDPDGHTTSYTRNAAGAVTEVTDPDGHTTTYAYDADGNQTSMTDGRGETTTYAYNAGNQMTSVTDPDAHTTSYTYDSVGDLLSVTDPTGAKTTYTYNADRKKTTMTAPDGNVSGGDPSAYTWTYSYDADGNQTVVTDPNGGTTTTTYDALGRPTSVTDPDGDTTTTAYDGQNNVTSVTDANGHTTTYAYDADGHKTSVTTPNGHATTYTYDANGNLTSVTTPSGGETTYTYDADNRKVTSVDPRGNVTGGDPADYTTTYAYDAAGRLTSVTDALGDSTSYAYDAAGNKTSVTDLDGHTTTTAYNADNQPVSVTTPTGAETTYAYDDAGNLTARTDANGHTTTYAYDADNRPTSLTTPNGDETTYAYDADGNTTTTVTGIGNVSGADPATGTISATYNNLDELTGLAYGDGSHSVSYSYDPAGNLTEMADGTGTTTYTYDPANQVTQVTNPETQTFDYTYDPDGNITATSYPNGTNVSSTYNDDDQLASVSSGGATTGFAYDAAGDLTSTTLPSGTGTTQDRTYDAAGRLTEVETLAGSAIISKFAATFDAVGNPTEIATTRGSSTTDAAYTYSADNRVTGYCPGATSCSGASDSIGYTYDPVGDLTQQVRTGVSDPGTTNDSYDTNNELTSAAVVGGSTTDYTYNANGDQITAGSGSMTYDLAGQVTSTTQGSTSTDYAYNGDGQLASATTGSSTTDYLWNTQSPDGVPELAIEENGSGSLVDSYIDGPSGTPISMTDSGGTYYYGYDTTGNVTDTIDSSGTPQASYTYEPYGQDTEDNISGSAPANPIQYAAQYQDPQTGMYLMGARQYNPATSAFTAPDPKTPQIGSPAVSGYTYVNGMPMTGWDPTGMSLVSVVTGAVTHIEIGAGLPIDAALFGVGTGVSDFVADPVGTTEAVVAHAVTIDEMEAENCLAGAEGAGSFADCSESIIPGGLAAQAGDLLDEMRAGCWTSAEETFGGLLFEGTTMSVGAGEVAGAADGLAEASVAASAEAADEEAGTAEAGMAAVRAAGQEGEDQAGIVQGAKVRIPSATGTAAYRVPDALTDTTLTEVKNVGNLSYTSQLQDFYAYASSTGRAFNLVVRSSTVLSAPLQAMVDSGQINLLRTLSSS